MRFYIREGLQICKFLFDLDNLSSFLSTFSNLGEPETNPYKKRFFEGGREGEGVKLVDTSSIFSEVGWRSWLPNKKQVSNFLLLKLALKLS